MNELIALLILLIYGTLSTVAAAAAEAAVIGRVALPSSDLRGAAVNSEAADKPTGSDPLVNDLSRGVIYLEDPGLKASAPIRSKIALKNRNFEPDIVFAPAGSSVSSPNEDPIFHDVFSLSRVKESDLGYYAAGERRAVKFDRAGVVQVYCHISSEMCAIIVVLPTAFWMPPAPDGGYSLAGFPPDAYDWVTRRRSAGFFRRHISEGTTPAEDFVIPAEELDSHGAPRPGSAQ